MALLQGTLMANAAIDIKLAETGKFRAMAAVALIIINNNIWVRPADRLAVPALRKILEAFAVTHGGMPLPTWQAYVKGVDVIAAKMADNLQGMPVVCGNEEVDFDAIADMSEVDAVTALVRVFTAYGVSSGGQIRDWARQEGFAPFDAERVKRERKTKADADRAAKLSGDVARLMGTAGRDSSSLPEAVAAPVSGLTNILAALAALSQSERLEALSALNAMLEADMAAVAALPDPVEPPMLQDDVVEAASPNRARRARAAKAA